jgi:hypothetical protein
MGSGPILWQASLRYFLRRTSSRDRTGTPSRSAFSSSGPRFGTLVHAILREVAWSGEGVPGLTRTQGRILGATAEEIEQAGEVVIGPYSIPCSSGQEIRSASTVKRPFCCESARVKSSKGPLTCSFLKHDVWPIVDFKTDLELESDQDPNPD